MTDVDLSKSRRETMRWLALKTLNAARPVGAAESLILICVNDVLETVTQLELRRELDYLRDRKLIEIEEQDRPQWHAALTRHGVDVVEYTIDCEPGIARPKKYW
jgi:DNA-binding transcriptional ArsR family regulator